MRIFRYHDDIPSAFRGAVVALGNFDGVHRGHQALIGHARKLAEERGAPLGVVAFEPHPQEFFRPSKESFRLTPFRTKARLIAQTGADVMFALNFDAQMAAMPAQDFVLDVLVKGLGVGCVVVGADFQFGKGRAGDVTLLSYMGEMEGFGVEVFAPVGANGDDKISSTDLCGAESGQAGNCRQIAGPFLDGGSASNMAQSVGAPSAHQRPI